MKALLFGLIGTVVLTFASYQAMELERATEEVANTLARARNLRATPESAVMFSRVCAAGSVTLRCLGLPIDLLDLCRAIS